MWQPRQYVREMVMREQSPDAATLARQAVVLRRLLLAEVGRRGVRVCRPAERDRKTPQHERADGEYGDVVERGGIGARLP